ncbi:TolB-like 6-blade propeller-like [Belliella buryatensis]|uniref:TolB-like 6-blade propeller-like n=1 Tax=Belliella buryatensis TaxID=1500549 RepID=A0A239BTK1_9BACT|nr:BF3164 family lipoprotein [Belliella buryatensis]SNS11347.1 TolB-like 6-blade propeller-like [Belliella buryatensis]
MKQLFPFILLTLLGCSNQEENLYFDKYVIFKPQDVPEINIFSAKRELPELLYPYNISGKEGKYIFVIEDSKIPEENNFIHIYNPITLEHINQKGVIGFGPNEIPYVSLIDVGFDEDNFWAYSAVDKKISRFNLLDQSPYSVEQFRQPESFFKMIRMISSSDSTYLGVSIDEPNRLVEYHKDGRKIAGYGEWEPVKTKQEMDNYLLSTLNSSWFIGDESKRYFITACVHRDRLEIFDYHTKKFVVIDGPDLDIPPFDIVGPANKSELILDIKSNPYRYRDVSITRNYIYALYGGIRENEFRETGILARKIFVFSLIGEPVIVLNLDRSLRAITVDETAGKIFGVTTDKDPNIAYFDIPDILKK